jgi:hypothetical protein
VPDKPLKRTEKLQIMLDDEELAAIDDWRFANRMPSRAAAIRELLRRGLGAGAPAVQPGNQPSTEYRVVDPAKGG